VRNPLGAISQASQLIKESENVVEEDHVKMIIEDVLDASRHNDKSPSKISLNEWLPRFVENYRATHELSDDVDCSFEGEVIVNVITGKLEQVLNNLFDNGLRYSKKLTGKATLQVIAGVDTKDDDIQSFLHIVDDGPGIDEEAAAVLFEPFHTTESPGTGHGLYIPKELCEANQSKLVYGRTDKGKSLSSISFSHPERSMY